MATCPGVLVDEGFARKAGVGLATLEGAMREALEAVDGASLAHGQMRMEWTTGTDWGKNYGKSTNIVI